MNVVYLDTVFALKTYCFHRPILTIISPQMLILVMLDHHFIRDSFLHKRKLINIEIVHLINYSVQFLINFTFLITIPNIFTNENKSLIARMYKCI